MTDETAPQTKELAVNEQAANFPALAADDGFSALMDPAKFEHLQRVATLYSKSKTIPVQYQNNVPDCFIGLQMAMRLEIEPFMFFQNTYIIQGKPGIEAKLAIALVNKRGPFRGQIMYEMHADGSGKCTGCTAVAFLKINGGRCEATVTWDTVKSEGWDQKSGSKWKTMPEQMFKYRSAVFLARAYCPEVLVGMQTNDELQDVYGDPKYIESAVVEGTASKSLTSKLLGDHTKAAPSKADIAALIDQEKEKQAMETEERSGMRDSK